MAQTLRHVFPQQSEEEQLALLALPSELYHENSKLTRADWLLQHQSQSDPVQRAQARHGTQRLQEYCRLIQFGAKQYLQAPRFALPPVSQALQHDIWQAFRQRHSVRQFSGQALSLIQLATLLAVTYGVTRYEDAQTQSYPRRAVPSGGGLYPLELYVLAFQVDGLEPGVYHYEIYSHSLELLAPGPVQSPLQQLLLYEEVLDGAAAALVVSGLFQRSRFKYGELSYRLILLETGHVGQNLCLSSTALGLGACPVAGFVEDSMNDLLGLDGVDETALYLLMIGYEHREDVTP